DSGCFRLLYPLPHPCGCLRREGESHANSSISLLSRTCSYRSTINHCKAESRSAGRSVRSLQDDRRAREEDKHGRGRRDGSETDDGSSQVRHRLQPVHLEDHHTAVLGPYLPSGQHWPDS
ncbi:hypothetical protein PMAYCL1PPCAC_13134, partial [Pristionchus mayeri]